MEDYEWITPCIRTAQFWHFSIHPEGSWIQFGLSSFLPATLGEQGHFVSLMVEKLRHFRHRQWIVSLVEMTLMIFTFVFTVDLFPCHSITNSPFVVCCFISWPWFCKVFSASTVSASFFPASAAEAAVAAASWDFSWMFSSCNSVHWRTVAPALLFITNQYLGVCHTWPMPCAQQAIIGSGAPRTEPSMGGFCLIRTNTPFILLCICMESYSRSCHKYLECLESLKYHVHVVDQT